MKTAAAKVLRNFLLTVLVFQYVAAVPEWYTASDGNEYLIETEQKYNWLEANDECRRQNLSLVVIDNEDKNTAFDALLRTNFVKLLPLWLGHHDEFSTVRGPRQFYSLASGKPIIFSNWFKGEPKNVKKQEHCAYVCGGVDYKWMNGLCTTRKHGYICEKDQSEVQCQANQNNVRKEVKELNEALAAEYASQNPAITHVMENTEMANNQIVEDLTASKTVIIADAKKALDKVAEKKPYLQAVLADVGPTYMAILRNALTEMSTVSTEAWESMKLNHVKAVGELTEIVDQFEVRLNQNTVDVDNLFG
ncbi:uncharacterized protein LOC142232379 [Haematobia irritans]|uniref:uncharacterized protein LOC142232379 n=1 Tax=Haematobia irritans TaxID=7368 RepID=UPI003F500CD8